MGLVDLPLDPLELIVDHIILESWNDSEEGRLLLNTRLVCKTLDHIISRCAFRKLNDDCLELQAWHMNDHTIIWLLMTKIALCFKRNIPHGLATAVREAAQSMAQWKDCNSEPSAREEEYWNTACAVVVANRGRAWVGKRLKRSCNDSSDLRSRLAGYPPHHRGFPVAASHGDAEIVQMLLNEGADMNAFDEYLGNPLYAAAYHGNTDIVNLLLDRGANVDIDGYWGTTLQAAAYQGHQEIMQLLLYKRADVNAGGWNNACTPRPEGDMNKASECC